MQLSEPLGAVYSQEFPHQCAQCITVLQSHLGMAQCRLGTLGARQLLEPLLHLLASRRIGKQLQDGEMVQHLQQGSFFTLHLLRQLFHQPWQIEQTVANDCCLLLHLVQEVELVPQRLHIVRQRLRHLLATPLCEQVAMELLQLLLHPAQRFVRLHQGIEIGHAESGDALHVAIHGHVQTSQPVEQLGKGDHFPLHSKLVHEVEAGEQHDCRQEEERTLQAAAFQGAGSIKGCRPTRLFKKATMSARSSAGMSRPS